MRFMKRVAILLVLLVLQGTAVWGAIEEEYGQAKEQYRQLQNAPAKKKYRENWMAVIDRFDSIAQRASGHRRAPDALYMAGKVSRGMWEVSRNRGDARKAADFFEEIVRSYPKSSLADDGLVLAAEIHEEILGNPSAAWKLYQRAAEDYPGGDQVRLSRRKLQELARFTPPPPIAERGGEAVTLDNIRTWSGPGYTRIVLDLSGKVHYTSNFLPGNPQKQLPPRLYVDLSETQAGKGLPETISVDDRLLQQIRTGKYSTDTFRVVMDLASMGEYKVFLLEDPLRLVVDVRGSGEGASAEIVAVATGGADPIGTILNEPVQPASLPLGPAVPTARKGALRIVVDAGHGGKDPGAIGKSGTYEKEVTLAMAKALARELERNLDCEVILTRDRDVYIPLQERTAIANRLGADLFISVHANASNSANAYGVETYYLNFSKNDKAAAVAARENGTSLKELGDLELILFDLMANSKINESSRLAAEIQRTLVSDLGRKYSHIKDLGVRQGPFYVLLGANMPSVLVEAAFISNPREEKRLKDSGYHQKTAAAISRAVRDYAASQKMIAVR